MDKTSKLDVSYWVFKLLVLDLIDVENSQIPILVQEEKVEPMLGTLFC